MNNSIKTFKDFDKFDLEPFADQLTKYLLIEAQFVEGSFVLSLNSEFGSGKTTFFEMWKEKLQSDDNKQNVVLLNAWQSDFHGDALLAIVSGLLDALGSSIKKQEKESIKETAGKLCKFALSIGNDVVKKYTGIDVIEAGKKAEPEKSKAKTTLGHACFEVYHKRQEIFNELKSQLTSITEKTEKPIIIIVDELDRCRPTYAIEFLETIKHFFNINGLIFVLGVDKEQLTSSAKALFGHDLNFDEYYRKFAHRNASLPVKSPEAINNFSIKLINEYLSLEAFKDKNRFSYINYSKYQREILAICNSFSLSARQIHDLFRIAAHVFSSLSETKSRLRWGFLFGTIFMIIFSIKNETVYHKIGRKKISLEEFTTYLKDLNLIKDNQTGGIWFANILYTGVFGVNLKDSTKIDDIKKEFIKLGINITPDDNSGTFKDRIVDFSNDAYSQIFMRSDSAFSQIYKILEGLKTFNE